MELTQRQSVVILLGVQLAAIVLLLIQQILSSGANIIAGLVAVVGLGYAILLACYWRGWDYARHATVIMVSLIAGLGMPEVTSQYFNPGVLIPAALALVLLTPAWVIGSAVVPLAIILLRAGGAGAYADSANLLMIAMVVGAMIMARLVTDTAQRRAERNAWRAEQALATAEAHGRSIAATNERIQTQLEEQRRLLDLVATLEAPAIQLADHVLFVPIVGHLDSRRSQEITARLLKAAHDNRAHLVVIDISGVATVDTAVASGLIGAARALHLLGCQVAISGISAPVAATLVHLGASLDRITTVRSPQEALSRFVLARHDDTDRSAQLN